MSRHQRQSMFVAADAARGLSKVPLLAAFGAAGGYRFGGSLALLFAWLAVVNPAQAQIDWNNTAGAGAHYHTGANWLGGVAPGSGDTARFNQAATYPIWWDSVTPTVTPDVGRLQVLQGTVTFLNLDAAPQHELFINGTGRGTFSDFSVSGATTVLTIDGLHMHSLSGAQTIGGATLTLNGSHAAGSTLTVGGSIGFQVDGNLNVQAGGVVSNETAFIGLSAGSMGAATVTGAGSQWNNSGNLSVGHVGDGTLNVTAGGVVSNSIGSIGSSTGSVATVTGAGSQWNNSGILSVGQAGDGTLNVEAGGVVSSTGGSIGSTASSAGVATVTGAGSQWNNSDNLSVGNSGNGTLNVTAGGVVSSTGGFIGSTASSTGVATVGGAGSTWTTGDLFVGGNSGSAGGTGTLTVLGGGLVDVGDTLTIWDDGTVNLFGGTLSLADETSLVKAGSTFLFASGVLELRNDSLISPTFLNEVLGGSSLTFGKELRVLGQATLATPLSIDGGELTAGSLSQAGLLQLNSGALRLTDQALTVDAGGLFGDTLDVAADMTIQIDQGITNNGVITGDGRIVASLTNSTIGEVRVAGGQSLRLSGSVANSGKLEAIGGALEFDQSVNNAASTSLITGRDATLRFNGGLTSDGSLALSFGTSDVFGDVSNNATGTIAVAGNSNATFYDDVTNGGTLNVVAGSTAVFFGALTGNGNIGGGDVQALGDLAPGASPGLMAFGGDLLLGVLANLQIEIGGTTQGSEYDALDITGAATLDGTLDVQLINGHTLGLNQQYEIFTAGTLTGTFDGLGDGDLVGTFGSVDLFIDYDTTAGNVTLFTIPEPGSFALIAAGTVLLFLRCPRRGA